jgi:hypothetical protein
VLLLVLVVIIVLEQYVQLVLHNIVPLVLVIPVLYVVMDTILVELHAPYVIVDVLLVLDLPQLSVIHVSLGIIYPVHLAYRLALQIHI